MGGLQELFTKKKRQAGESTSTLFALRRNGTQWHQSKGKEKSENSPED